VHSHRYRIAIKGGLGPSIRWALEDFKIESHGVDTYLIADLDQAALYGAINRIQSLGLELIELTRMTGPESAQRPT
jgi:hypothetical protein